MKRPALLLIAVVVALLSFTIVSPATAADDEFVFGMLLVGPYNDHGWSEAHYDAGKYVEEKLPGAKMIYIDKVNPADRPGVTVPQLVDDLVSKGAKLIIANSDDLKDGVREAALMHPDVYFIHASGDDALTGKGPKNLSNVMGQMIYGKAIAGFAAGMTTRTGKIGYVGPLINEETRRLAAACYLGARHAWVDVRKMPADDFNFKVTWIGFWFNIPGVTADPTQVGNNFINTGYDVVISGIDTTEALLVAGQARQSGKDVYSLAYDYVKGCDAAPEACLGVPYFNWGPSYLKMITAAKDGSWTQQWQWVPPDWKDINNPDTSMIGFKEGPALSADAKTAIDQFIKDLADAKYVLFRGPLNYQDGEVFLKDHKSIATDEQIWYLKMLLEGMEGQSSAQ